MTENTDVGFDHPTTGAEAQATALAVTQYIDTVISFPGTIDFRFNDEPANGTGSLANASAITNSAAVGFQPGAVVEHGVNENDVTAPFPGVPDAQGNFDFGYTWNTGLDAPTGSEYDLFSVILHELTHSMGISSALKSDGNPVHLFSPTRLFWARVCRIRP